MHSLDTRHLSACESKRVLKDSEALEHMAKGQGSVCCTTGALLCLRTLLTGNLRLMLGWCHGAYPWLLSGL